MSHPPYFMHGAARQSRWVICCDHASNAVPQEMGGSLGLSEHDMGRHIAYDIGAQGVALALGDALDAPVICSTFSRLVIDPNRGEDDPTLLMRLYDGTIIPGNRYADAAERARRVQAYWQPYHDALEVLLAHRDDAALVSVHSFTPRLQARARRPWHVGVLHAWDQRLSDPFLAALEREPDLVVGRNEPYRGHLAGDTVDQHALRAGRHNTLIELRNDLIETPETQAHWGQRLAPLLAQALADAET